MEHEDGTDEWCEGCDAGLLNVPKIKGVHQAMRSGLLAADLVAANGPVSAGWDAALRASPVMSELKKVRNIKPGFKKGLWFGLLNSAWETATAGLSPSAASQHLAKMRAEGLVATRREAQSIHYRLADPAALRVLQTLFDIYRGPDAAGAARAPI